MKGLWQKTRRVFILFSIPIFLLPNLISGSEVPQIKIVDSASGNPIHGAVIAFGKEGWKMANLPSTTSDARKGKILVRAPGYMRAERVLHETSDVAPKIIRLKPFHPRALYLSFYGIGEKSLRGPALDLIAETELNALVIDVKSDRGMIPYKSAIPLAAQIGAQRILTVKDMKGLIQSFKEKGIYTIARIVVFKDDLLALARPDLAVKTKGGSTWRDRENLAWVDPFKSEVWDYNVQIAIEAAQQGFDEIQFDYVRFPDSSAPKFSRPNTEENRVNAISGFLREAKSRLKEYNVFLSADIFGYVCWNPDDTKIGQKLDALLPYLDYLSPMLYPSGFHLGIPGYRNPMENIFEFIYLSLKRAQERTQVSSLRFRPWLQAFRDYAFDRRPFHTQEIQTQIRASESFGSSGWMLWNPTNVYSSQGLSKKDPSKILTGVVQTSRIH
jgi:hypothetical protein